VALAVRLPAPGRTAYARDPLQPRGDLPAGVPRPSCARGRLRQSLNPRRATGALASLAAPRAEAAVCSGAGALRLVSVNTPCPRCAGLAVRYLAAAVTLPGGCRVIVRAGVLAPWLGPYETLASVDRADSAGSPALPGRLHSPRGAR
jgi:hypothetical protein